MAEQDETPISTDSMTAITVPAAELRSRLKAVIPHAGIDDTPPSLTCVRFELRTGSLYLVTTDRYTMAVARLRIAGTQAAPVPDQAALLPMPAVKALRRMIKGADVVALAIGDGTLTIDSRGTGQSCTWDTQPGKFPDWRPMLHEMLGHESAELGERFGIDPRHLRKFTPAKWHPVPDPLHVRVLERPADPAKDVSPSPVWLAVQGDWFLGVLVPVRAVSDQAAARGRAVTKAWDDWAALTAPADAKEQAA